MPTSRSSSRISSFVIWRHSIPRTGALQSMVEKSRARRDLAAELLQLARQVGEVKDVAVGGFWLSKVILATLEVESLRATVFDLRPIRRRLHALRCRSARVMPPCSTGPIRTTRSSATAR